MWRVASTLLLIAAVGCDTVISVGVPLASSCITTEDVTTVPPGDATGIAELGTFRPVTNLRTSCSRCGSNTYADAECTDAPVDTSVRITLRQEGGVLIAQGSDGSSMRGGIDADNTFVLGGVATPTSDDGVQTGQGLALFVGQITGDFVVATMTLHLTMNFSDGVLDLQSVHSVTWQRVN